LLLPGAILDPEIIATSDIDAATAEAEAALLAIPAQSLRRGDPHASVRLTSGLPVLHCSKGIEAGRWRTMSEVSAELLPNSPVAVLSGPTFAAEVARGLPTAVTIASRDAALARFRRGAWERQLPPLLVDDPTGAEIGGRQELIAIACGTVVGARIG